MGDVSRWCYLLFFASGLFVAIDEESVGAGLAPSFGQLYRLGLTGDL
jgi:hypothetical protein